MAARPDIKICGITTPAALDAAIAARASHVGFNFFPPSPRFLTPATASPIEPNSPPTHMTWPDPAAPNAPALAACRPPLPPTALALWVFNPNLVPGPARPGGGGGSCRRLRRWHSPLVSPTPAPARGRHLADCSAMVPNTWHAAAGCSPCGSPSLPPDQWICTVVLPRPLRLGRSVCNASKQAGAPHGHAQPTGLSGGGGGHGHWPARSPRPATAPAATAAAAAAAASRPAAHARCLPAAAAAACGVSQQRQQQPRQRAGGRGGGRGTRRRQQRRRRRQRRRRPAAPAPAF